ncbi:MAG: DUF262 domain-containing protein, partial [Nitrospirae bacterium]|nr:DUF262 domain-containing protein [Nitrospirota bacterium]
MEREIIMDVESQESVIDAKAVDDEETTGVETANQSYDARLISIENLSFPIFQIMRKIQNNEINLQPDFQRKFAWDNMRRSRLIESILIKIPLPSFYIDAI